VIDVLRSPRTLIEQALGLGIAGIGLWWWLGWPEGSVFQLLISGAAILVILALLFVLGSRLRRVVVTPHRPLSLVMAMVFALAAYGVVHWVPVLTSLTAQMVSAAARFGIGYLLLVLAWCALVVAISGGSPRSIQESTVARP